MFRLDILAILTIGATIPAVETMGPTRSWVWLACVILIVSACIWLHGRLAESKPFDPGPWRVPRASLQEPYPETPGFAGELILFLVAGSVALAFFLLS